MFALRDARAGHARLETAAAAIRALAHVNGWRWFYGREKCRDQFISLAGAFDGRCIAARIIDSLPG